MARRALRDARDFDENTEDDWLGPFFVRAFGKSRFSMGEIMDGGREFRNTWLLIMETYFDYQWDEEIGRRRELQATRQDSATLALEYVQTHYDEFLERFAAGENLYQHEIEFDSRTDRDLTRERR